MRCRCLYGYTRADSRLFSSYQRWWLERRLGVWSCGIPFAEELIAHLWVETDQIKEKKYIASLEPYIGDILLVGINYDKKTKKNECLIERRK